jgi:RNA-binding protein with serine-rich domain 1
MKKKEIENLSRSNSSSYSDSVSLRGKSPNYKSKIKNPKHENQIKTLRFNPCVYVQNLTVNVNENHLNEIFSIYGKIRKIIKNKLAKNQRTHISSIIIYDKIESAEYSQKCMDGGQIDGMEVKVKFHNLTDQEIESYLSNKKLEAILKDRENLKYKEQTQRKQQSIKNRRRSYSRNKKTKYKRERSRSLSKKNNSRRKSSSESSYSESSSFSSSSSSDDPSSSYSSSSSGSQ